MYRIRAPEYLNLLMPYILANNLHLVKLRWCTFFLIFFVLNAVPTWWRSPIFNRYSSLRTFLSASLSSNLFKYDREIQLIFRFERCEHIQAAFRYFVAQHVSVHGRSDPDHYILRMIIPLPEEDIWLPPLIAGSTPQAQVMCRHPQGQCVELMI